MRTLRALIVCSLSISCGPDGGGVVTATTSTAAAPPRTDAKPPAGSASAAPSASVPAGPKLCEKAATFAKRFESIDVDAARIGAGDVALPESKDGSKPDTQLPLLVVTAKDVRLNDEVVTRMTELAAKLPSKEVLLRSEERRGGKA